MSETEWCPGGRKCRCDPWHAERRPVVLEQEMFCCALVKANGAKVKWLHTTCHDYWDRLQAKDAEIERLRELVRERDIEATRTAISAIQGPAS